LGSERAVREALDELERQGKIVRRVGRGGSVVVKVPALPEDKVIDRAVSNGGVALGGELGSAPNRSILAIGEHDGGIFDQAMQVFLKQARSAKFVVHCRFMTSYDIDEFDIPSLNAEPQMFLVFRQHFLPLAERLHAAGHRVVFLGTPYLETVTQVPTVSGDQEQGGYLAVRHLIELGHRRIAFHYGWDYRHLWRWLGCQRALDEARESGVEVEYEILDWSVTEEWKRHSHLVKSYFDRPDAPTALVSWNDSKAVELLTVLLTNGISVPQDVSLVGYDNQPLSSEVHPALTTVDGGLSSQVVAALRLLKQATIQGSHQTLVIPSLIPRESTAPPR
jgi:hypothetical protein